MDLHRQPPHRPPPHLPPVSASGAVPGIPTPTTSATTTLPHPLAHHHHHHAAHHHPLSLAAYGSNPRAATLTPSSASSAPSSAPSPPPPSLPPPSSSSYHQGPGVAVQLQQQQVQAQALSQALPPISSPLLQQQQQPPPRTASYADSDVAPNETGQAPGGHSSSSNTPVDADSPPKKKQKRNKPTLSCQECVDRKTKCDRGRPHCLACIKRQTECKYARVANLLEETSRTVTNGRRMTKPPKAKPGPGPGSDGGALPVPNIADRGVAEAEHMSRGAVALSTGLLSHVPYWGAKASNVFGIGSEHPFANYWTCEGGLREVVSVLPDKMQADALVSRYFECVDPVYPLVHRQTFYADYEQFWSVYMRRRADGAAAAAAAAAGTGSDGGGKGQGQGQDDDDADASFVALILVMLAMGTQFIPSTPPAERKQTAEFYASASNQALRVFSYLSNTSLRSIQAMVLITYFLINDNHASDGWAFAGVLIRQAYAMGLHRDPNIVTPNLNPFEKQQRRKVWQAVLLQDTFLTVLLSLPPSATHTDVNVEDLLDDGSSIASSDPTDTAYIRASWTLANLVQETVCSPRSLDLPICTTARHKSKLVADFRAVYRSFPDVFRSWDAESLTAAAATNKRVVRQTLFLTSNYFHNLMLVHASESPDVPANARATLEAAHDAITSFFLLFSLLEFEARVWWVFNHRAFLEALCIGNVLREEAARHGNPDNLLGRDPLFVRARADIARMMQIMQAVGDDSDAARTRVQVLAEFLS